MLRDALLSFVLVCTSFGVNAQSLTLRGEPRAVYLVEMFTSQGCSSCPPAEAWLADFKDDPRLLDTLFPIAFHVDYWDYLGWKDIYSRSDASSRQRQYKVQGVTAGVYTPGFVVNGQEWKGWFWGKDIPAPNTTSGILNIDLESTQLNVSYEGDTAASVLNVAVVGLDLLTQIKAGENKGKHLSQQFVMLWQKTVVEKNQRWQLTLPSEYNTRPSRIAFIAWVTQPGEAKPIQIAGSWLNPL